MAIACKILVPRKSIDSFLTPDVSCGTPNMTDEFGLIGIDQYLVQTTPGCTAMKVLSDLRQSNVNVYSRKGQVKFCVVDKGFYFAVFDRVREIRGCSVF